MNNDFNHLCTINRVLSFHFHTWDNQTVRQKVNLEPDEWIQDSGCSRHMTGNKDLFSSYKTFNGGNVLFGSNTKSKIIDKGQICDKKCKVLFSETDSEIIKDGITIGKGIRKNGLYIMKMGNSPKDALCLTSIDDTSTLWHRSKAYIVLNKETMKVEESLNIKFDESPPPKSPPLVDDDFLEINIIENQDKDLEVKENEPLNKEIANINESKDHPIETVIGSLNQRTLRSQVQNQSNFFCFVSSVEPKNIKEAIQDESWSMAMQEELN
ncbi:hypothetical protein Tco_1531063 [Tanacetum coccineum]